jgi:hypothetical protein
MLPTVTRASEEILRTIPDALREGALALGAPRWQVTLRVVIPTALAGLVTAVILGIARAVGETAPMILTSLGADTTNTNPFSGAQADLPLFVWKRDGFIEDEAIASQIERLGIGQAVSGAVDGIARCRDGSGPIRAFKENYDTLEDQYSTDGIPAVLRVVEEMIR